MQKMEIPSNMFVAQITKEREVNESHALNYFIESKYISSMERTHAHLHLHTIHINGIHSVFIPTNEMVNGNANMRTAYTQNKINCSTANSEQRMTLNMMTK